MSETGTGGAAADAGNALDAAATAAAAAAADKGTGGAGAAAGGEGGAKDAGQQPGPDAWKDPFKAAGVPDRLFGKDAGETAVKLAEDWKKQADTLATRDYAGKTIDDYKIELKDEVRAVAQIEDNDPIYKQFRTFLMEEGLPAANSGRAIGKFVTHLVETGVIEKPMTVEDMMLDIDKLETSGTAAERREATKSRLVNINVQLNTLVDRKELTKSEAQELRGLSTTGAGVRLIEKLLGRQAGGLSLGGRAAPITDQDIKERQKDPRYLTTSPKYDAAFREETDKMARDYHAQRRG